MNMRHIWAGLALTSLMTIPAVLVTQEKAHAVGAEPKAEWSPAKATTTKSAPKVVPKKKKVVAPLTPVEPETSLPTTNTSAQSAAVADQSQEVLAIDFATAAAITAQGPKLGYASALSDEGILYDANGASPVGKEAAPSRFGTFPADVRFIRTPERALAAGGSGSSWGTYSIKRGDTVLSLGRYISVWRREASGWKMMSELAAGRTLVPPPASSIKGVLPRRPTAAGRVAPEPVGVPLTVPTPPDAPQSSEQLPKP